MTCTASLFPSRKPAVFFPRAHARYGGKIRLACETTWSVCLFLPPRATMRPTRYTMHHAPAASAGNEYFFSKCCVQGVRVTAIFAYVAGSAIFCYTYL